MSKSRSVLSFDYGTKSIGVAIGQELTGTASPLLIVFMVDLATRLNCTMNV
jgi:RNase H-fold protein (predicted Holliday junction resolvase)